MRVIVTGGAGFIGSHLVKRLQQLRHTVLPFPRCDLRETSNFPSFEDAEIVYHLAATVGSLQYLHGSPEAELYALQSNLAIDTNVFRACLGCKVKRLVYASSVAVYPMTYQMAEGCVLQERNFDARDADGGYGWSKLIGELELGYMRGIDIGIARIFNIYGVNEPLQEGKAHFVGDFIKRVIQARDKIEIRGLGNETRDYLYISDCVDALIKLGENASNPPLIVNVGSGTATSIKDMAQKIIDLSGKKLDIKYRPMAQSSPASRTADMRYAQAVLGWKPQVSLEDGLQKTYRWVEQELSR